RRRAADPRCGTGRCHQSQPSGLFQSAPGSRLRRLPPEERRRTDLSPHRQALVQRRGKAMTPRAQTTGKLSILVLAWGPPLDGMQYQAASAATESPESSSPATYRGRPAEVRPEEISSTKVDAMAR